MVATEIRRHAEFYPLRENFTHVNDGRFQATDFKNWHLITCYLKINMSISSPLIFKLINNQMNMSIFLNK